MVDDTAPMSDWLTSLLDCAACSCAPGVVHPSVQLSNHSSCECSSHMLAKQVLCGPALTLAVGMQNGRAGRCMLQS